ncbi:MAG: hypothetical protein KA941_10400 [Flavobacteriales bacterium]|nr:hypothetical protein [Flavobacteriales bacterium]
MKSLALVVGTLCAWTASVAQVEVNTSVEFTGSPENRAINGLASPSDASSAITVEGSLRSEWAWANATLQGTTLALTVDPPIAAYRDGLLVRFVAPATTQGPVSVSLNGLPALALVRPDGEAPSDGQVIIGRVCEVMHANGKFHLLNAPETGCPPGYLQVNTNYCIEANSSPAVEWYTASDQCAVRGGKLCTWDEYYGACALLQGQFTNIFVDWEWLDDTSNHSHGANQVGRTICTTIRTRIVTVPARVRCCYHPR